MTRGWRTPSGSRTAGNGHPSPTPSRGWRARSPSRAASSPTSRPSAPSSPTTPQEELAIALRGHLYSELASPPPGKLKWVMNAEWLQECLRAAEDRRGLWTWQPPTTTLLGITIEVRGDGGVPHLERDHGEPTSEPS